MAKSRAPLSLRTKLVAITVALGFFVIALISSVSVITLQRSLESRLDAQLASAFDRAVTVLNAPGFRGDPGQSIEDRRGRELRERDDVADEDGDDDGGRGEADDSIVNTPRSLAVVDAQQILNGPAQAPGTLALVLDGGTLTAGYLDDDGEIESISTRELDQLSQIAPDARPHTIELGEDLGAYRVQAALVGENAVVVGLPVRDVRQTVFTLGATLFTLALLGLAALAVVATLVIRRTMRPLEQVALAADNIANRELSRGEVDQFERVVVPGVGDNTEVGRVVGAVNSMLGNVESALVAREASEQKVRSFVADASHELRTPLASIRGYSELVRRMGGELPPDMQTAIGRIESESIRMTELVEDLLLLARLDQGAELSMARVDLTDVLRTAVNDAEVSDTRDGATAHEWIVELHASPLWVAGDRNRLYQVFANLLANARTHTPDGTTVRVRTQTRDDHAIVTVEDNGPGIDADLQSSVFTRFVRGDSSRTKGAEHGGTGLGLSIAQALIEAHGGTVTLTSAPGETVFEVSLPTSNTMA